MSPPRPSIRSTPISGTRFDVKVQRGSLWGPIPRSPCLSGARVSLIDPQMLQARELFGPSFQRQWHRQGHRRTVLQIRRLHPSFEHHTQPIHQKMPLSSTQFLRSIVAAHPSHAGGLYGLLGLQDTSTRLRVANCT
jgi:hypothetical protein